MTISKDDAARALGEIEEARGRVREVTAYAYASPYLILWGVAWLIADTFTQFAPRLDLVWPLTALLFTLASFAVGYAQRSSRLKGGGQSRGGWRGGATALLTMAFLAALFCVLWPIDGRQIHSIFGLLAGFAYAIMGLWLGGRLLILGLTLAGLTLFAFYGATHWYPLFMGVVSGGALILGGLWLRKI